MRRQRACRRGRATTITKLARDDRPEGVAIRFQLSEAAAKAVGPWGDAELVGVFPTVGQTIEDRHGKPIRVDVDLHNRQRSEPVAGPLAAPKAGENLIEWPARP